jgi:hypothetical protein
LWLVADGAVRVFASRWRKFIDRIAAVFRKMLPARSNHFHEVITPHDRQDRL